MPRKTSKGRRSLPGKSMPKNVAEKSEANAMNQQTTDVTAQGFQKAASRVGSGSRMVSVGSLPSPDVVGTVTNASEIGATRRPGSSAPKSSGPQTSNEGMRVPSVPSSYRQDGP
jgi:hypothetical protein